MQSFGAHVRHMVKEFMLTCHVIDKKVTVVIFNCRILILLSIVFKLNFNKNIKIKIIKIVVETKTRTLR